MFSRKAAKKTGEATQEVESLRAELSCELRDFRERLVALEAWRSEVDSMMVKLGDQLAGSLRRVHCLTEQCVFDRGRLVVLEERAGAAAGLQIHQPEWRTSTDLCPGSVERRLKWLEEGSGNVNRICEDVEERLLQRLQLEVAHALSLRDGPCKTASATWRSASEEPSHAEALVRARLHGYEVGAALADSRNVEERGRGNQLKLSPQLHAEMLALIRDEAGTTVRGLIDDASSDFCSMSSRLAADLANQLDTVAGALKYQFEELNDEQFIHAEKLGSEQKTEAALVLDLAKRADSHVTEQLEAHLLRATESMSAQFALELQSSASVPHKGEDPTGQLSVHLYEHKRECDGFAKRSRDELSELRRCLQNQQGSLSEQSIALKQQHGEVMALRECYNQVRVAVSSSQVTKKPQRNVEPDKVSKGKPHVVDWSYRFEPTAPMADQLRYLSETLEATVAAHPRDQLHAVGQSLDPPFPAGCLVSCEDLSTVDERVLGGSNVGICAAAPKPRRKNARQRFSPAKS